MLVAQEQVVVQDNSGVFSAVIVYRQFWSIFCAFEFSLRPSAAGVKEACSWEQLWSFVFWGFCIKLFKTCSQLVSVCWEQLRVRPSQLGTSPWNGFLLCLKD